MQFTALCRSHPERSFVTWLGGRDQREARYDHGPAPALGIAYVGWLSPSNSQGYVQYLRAFSVTGGWLSAPVQVSSAFGDPSVWPGDTFGISALTPTSPVLSWGSATTATGKKSEIFAALVTVQLP